MKITGKKILLIAAGLSVVGIIPKIIKNQQHDFELLGGYFLYIGLCFLTFYAINLLLWAYMPARPHWLKYMLGLAGGYVFLMFINLLLLNVHNAMLMYVLNLKETTLAPVLVVSAFRAFIIQSVAFACLVFLKKDEENTAFQTEIDALNRHLDSLKNPQAKEKHYKSTILTDFKDKLLPVDVSEIAFFHMAEGVVFQYLFSGEKFVQNTSLEGLENDLNPALFYRANRQFLIHKKAVRKVERIDNRKLKALLTIPLPEEIIISKAKSTAFIRWLEA